MNSIIVGGFIEKNGKFLLVQEAKEICRGKWNIPAGRLEPKESIFYGAKREIFEETGCKVELTGFIKVCNKILEDGIWMSIIFSTKLLEESININKSEILDVKWFSYEEILKMKDELRSPNWIINNLNVIIEKKQADLNLINIILN